MALLVAFSAVAAHLLVAEFLYVDFRNDDIPIKLRDCMSVLHKSL